MFSSRSCFSSLCPRRDEWALAPTLLAATVEVLAAATHRCADVAQLADALDSKSGTRKSVWVRPPPSAPTYCFSYSPLPRRFSTVNPAFFASETESGLSLLGDVNVEITLRTGFLHAGHRVNSGALKGRRNVNFPPQTVQSPSQSSYS